jgi:hypothetical protein
MKILLLKIEEGYRQIEDGTHIPRKKLKKNWKAIA